MEIKINSLLAGAKKAEGLVVIIDVFRAFTTAAVALERGAERLVLTSEIDDAYMLRKRRDGDCCIGEVGGKKPEDFDFNNSPYEVSKADMEGRIPILSTRAGTVGANAAWHAETMYGASLVNAGATADIIRRANPPLVNLVAMGRDGRERTDEDEICAIYMRSLLTGSKPDPAAIASIVRTCAEAAKFNDPTQPHFHPLDLEMAVQVDRLPFAIRIARKDRLLVAFREEIT